jgi:hypothetical protein
VILFSIPMLLGYYARQIKGTQIVEIVTSTSSQFGCGEMADCSSGMAFPFAQTEKFHVGDFSNLTNEVDIQFRRKQALVNACLAKGWLRSPSGLAFAGSLT